MTFQPMSNVLEAVTMGFSRWGLLAVGLGVLFIGLLAVGLGVLFIVMVILAKVTGKKKDDENK